MERDINTIIQLVVKQARELGACPLLRGDEDLAGLIKVFTSPQGMEFCLRHRYPNTATFRLFKPFGVERFGIYIDAGDITLKNPNRAILVGRTVGTVACDTTERHEIVLLNGAKAVVNASKWSVAVIKAGSGCACVKNVSDNAVIL